MLKMLNALFLNLLPDMAESMLKKPKEDIWMANVSFIMPIYIWRAV